MLTPGGALVIIDRKKNLVKLKGGEYVALENMNTAYNNSPFVNVEMGGVCSYAGGELDRAVCLAQCKVTAAAAADTSRRAAPPSPRRGSVRRSVRRLAERGPRVAPRGGDWPVTSR